MNSNTKQTSPLVSVIIPAFNRVSLIGETLDSILAQTYTNWECIIVDDGSTDNTVQVIEEYCKKDNRFKYFKRDREPKGAPTCRNIGIQKSKGEYIIFLDSDDLLKNTCIEKRINLFFDNDDLDALIFQSKDFYAYPEDSDTIWNIEKDRSDLLRFIELDIVWSITGPIWKKKCIAKLNGFNEYLKSWQDWELHIRAITQGIKYKKFLNLDPDNYCRTERSQSIGQASLTKEHLDSQSAVFSESVIPLVAKKNPLNTGDIKTALLGLIYYFAKKNISYGFRSDGLQYLASNYFQVSKNILQYILLYSNILLLRRRGGSITIFLCHNLISSKLLNSINQDTFHKFTIDEQ